MSVLGALSKVAKAKPLRSTLDEAVETLARPKGTGAEYLKELEKTKGVKPTEIKERGIDKVLTDLPKVNKEEIVKAIKSKANPTIKQKMLGADTHKELSKDEQKYLKELEEDYKANDLRPSMYNDYLDLKNRAENSSEFDLHRESEKLFEKFNNARENGQTRLANELSRQLDTLYDRQQRIGKVLKNPTKYEEYTLPNGQNYREILLKLPQKEGEQFTQGHFDEPNLLAHMRVSDRAGPNGEKVLHLEELQSDWHQKGRNKGYTSNASEDDVRKAYNAQEYNAVAFDDLRPEDRAYEIKKYRESGVPDAPFKKNWHEVALKKLINYATENGYDKIAITPGAEQAQRFNLSKHIDSIMLAPNPYENKNVYPYYFKAFDKKGNRVADDIVNEDKLAEFIGKEQAKRLLLSPVNPMGERMISGADIVTGGEGMKGFYNKILPDYLNKLGKPHGAEVQLHSLPIETGSEMSRGASGNDMVPSYTPTYTNLHTFDLTPSLKNEVTQKGLPLYQQIGIPLGGAEAVNQAQPEPEMKRGGKVVVSNNPDTMFMELTDRKMQAGGAVKAIGKMLEEAPEMANVIRGLFKSESPELSNLIDKLKTPERQSVIPMPNRWFTKPEDNPQVQPLVEKVLSVNNMTRDQFHSGAFVDPKTGKILDKEIHKDVGVAIDPITNRPVMTSGGLSGHEALPLDLGSMTNSNLLKQGKYFPVGGDPILNDLGFIATIEKSGMGHKYGLGTEYATPTLLRNTMGGDNPTLRPRSVGDVFGVGDVVGQIKTTSKGPVHDVYEKLFVAPKGSDVQGVKLNKAKGGAVRSLETNLPALPKTDYHSIDKLMAHISKEHKIAPQKLHDDFVAKHHMTPDTWIKRK
jgi:hypothetical protein